MNKLTNEHIKRISIDMGDAIETSACRTCKEAYCCSYQHQISISKSEFDEIVHLITPEQIERAKQEVTQHSTLNGEKVYQCPFLNEEGLCEIYDDRFLICSQYSVVGTNSQCNRDNGDSVVKIVNPTAIFLKAMEDEKVKERLMKHSEGEMTDVLDEFVYRFL